VFRLQLRTLIAAFDERWSSVGGGSFVSSKTTPDLAGSERKSCVRAECDEPGFVNHSPFPGRAHPHLGMLAEAERRKLGEWLACGDTGVRRKICVSLAPGAQD
jgi:hypothetical protein